MEFASPGERSALYDTLRAAEAAGAVALEMDRDAPHLIARVTLRDAAALYRHVGRQPEGEIVEEALARLLRTSVDTEEAEGLRDLLVSAWRGGRSAAGLSPANLEEAVGLLRAADAAFARIAGGRLPLRTCSARLLGDSKALERAMPKLLALLQQAGRLDPALDREEAVRLLGLEKYAQPILIAGPLRVGGADVGNWPFVGVPPDLISDLDASSAVSLLTIENLESFNRHARETRRIDEAVIYLGGFPAASVVDAVRRVVDSAELGEVHHWGDIDPGGVAIARYLEEKIEPSLRLHLMTPEIARRYGRPAEAAVLRAPVPVESSLADLARYLKEPGAQWLEQECLDPEPVLRPV